MQKMTGLLLAVVVGTMLPTVQSLQAGEVSLLAPVAQDITPKAKTAEESYVLRTGTVQLAIEQVAGAGKEATDKEGLYGQQYQLSFFSDATVSVRIETLRRSPDGTLSLGGRRVDGGLATFSLTTSLGSYLIHFQDERTGRLYRVLGDANTGLGTVREVDPTLLPPQYDSHEVFSQE